MFVLLNLNTENTTGGYAGQDHNLACNPALKFI